MTIVTGNANTKTLSVPGANYHDGAAEANPETNEAYKIAIPQCATTAVVATLILEFMPV
jgi:hypothetical protein